MSTDRDFSAVINQQMSGFDTTMGFRMVKVTLDEVVLAYDIDERHRQPYGIVHGGVHCAAVETVCSIAASINAASRGQSVVGIENHTSFVHAVRRGTVTVTATPLSRGRRSQIWEATARDEAGKIISTGRLRLLCLDAGSELAGETVKTKSGEERE